MRCLIWLTPAQHFQTFCQSIKGSKWRLIFIADAFPPHFSPIRKENLKKAKQRQRKQSQTIRENNKTKASAFPRRQANTPKFSKKESGEHSKEKAAERKAAH